MTIDNLNTVPYRQIIEGVLLAAGEPVSIQRLLQLFEEEQRPSLNELHDILGSLAAECESRGIELKELASGYAFQVKASFSPWISRYWEEKPARYSRALLETLALIAYRQPITRSEIETIRGVSVSSNIIKTLQERDWIRIVGYRDLPGKPALFATTKQFLDHFNLKNLQELPKLIEMPDFATTHLPNQLKIEMA